MERRPQKKQRGTVQPPHTTEGRQPVKSQVGIGNEPLERMPSGKPRVRRVRKKTSAPQPAVPDRLREIKGVRETKAVREASELPQVLEQYIAEPEYYMSRDQARRWNAAAAALMFVLLTAGEARAAWYGPPYDEGGRVEEFEPEEESMDDESISASLDEMLEDGPHTPDSLHALFHGIEGQRGDSDLLSELSQEQLDYLVEQLSTYPVDRVLAELSDLTGIPAEELAARSNIEMVAIYNRPWLNARNREIAELSGATGFHPELIDLYMAGGGASSTDGKFLGLNAEVVYRHHTPEQLEQGVEELITHEFLHTYDHEDFFDDPQWEERYTYLDYQLYEGLTQALTLEIARRLNKPNEPVLDMIYPGGEKQAAYLVLNELGEEFVFKAYMNNEYYKIANAWNEKHGEGSWERAMRFSFGEQNDQVDHHILPLCGLMQELGPAGKDAYLETNQRMANSSIIPLFNEETGAVEAIYIHDSRLKNPITAGVAWFEIPVEGGAPFLVVLPLAMESDGGEPEGPDFDRDSSFSSQVVSPMMSMLRLTGGFSDGRIREHFEKNLAAQKRYYTGLYSQHQESLKGRPQENEPGHAGAESAESGGDAASNSKGGGTESS